MYDAFRVVHLEDCIERALEWLNSESVSRNYEVKEAVTWLNLALKDEGLDSV